MSEKNTKKQDQKQLMFESRKASKKENDLLLSRMKSTHDAAKLRNTLYDEPVEKFHSPVEFSWRAFWQTFVYENLPPVIFSPIAALFFEKSINRAWHVCQNRNLLALSKEHNPISSIIISWLIVYPGSWLMTAAFLIAVFMDYSMFQNVDRFLVILAYLCLFMRRLIICAKYGFFRAEEIEKLSHPAPRWSADKTQRKFIGRGWSNPEEYPGLLEDEMTSAMDENDICLHGIPLIIDDKNENLISTQNTSEIFTAKTITTKKNEISSAFLLFNIIRSVYRKHFIKPYRLILYPSMFALILTPFIVKYFYGVYLFGDNQIEKFLTSMTIFGFLICFQLLFFGLICSIDFERRIETTKKIGDLVKFPGIKLSSLFDNISLLDDKKIFIDLHKRKNVFAWMNMRNVLRSFGESYLYRIESYTSILVFYSLFCVAILNLIVWTEMRHHISTIFLIGVIIITISGISIYSIFKAIKLQSLSEKHRDFIRNEIFIIEEEICEIEQTSENKDKLSELKNARALLNQVDQNINYKELIYKPTTILGYAANSSVIGSVLGLVLTGCLFAVQGFVSTEIVYDISGWFNF